MHPSTAQVLTVLQMLPDLETGGVERGTLELGRYLAANGHRSLVLSGGGRLVRQLVAEGSVHFSWPVGKKNPATLKYLRPLRRLLLREGVNVLHLRSRVPAWLGYLAWRTLPRARRPALVTTFHGFYSINRYSAIMTRGERVIAVSDAVREHILRHYRVAPERIVLIHRGVDTGVFDPARVAQERVDLLRRRWLSVGNRKPVILLPGRITRWKGQEVFINALTGIRDLDWVALCVGKKKENQSYAEFLEHRIELSGLQERVKLVGLCDDMAAAYLTADIVVSASSTEAEAFGRVAVEAQAMGRPVVATAQGGSLETVLPGRTGWLVKPNDSGSLTAALREALLDPERCRQYGENGRRWVGERFTVEKMCARTVETYYSLLEKPGTS